MKKIILLILALTASVAISFSQYNLCASKSVVKEEITVKEKDEQTGELKTVTKQVEVQNKDTYGNPDGNKYDLAVDGAFNGQTIVVLQLYNFDFSHAQAALQEKGFGILRFTDAPDPQVLREALKDASQVWVISNITPTLNIEHAKVIKDFYETGRGVYIWGDNDPGIPDANLVAEYLIGASLSGNYMGDQIVTLKSDSTNSGMRQDHLITTGLEHLYEGITISTISDPNGVLTPLTWSSDGNVVTAVLDDQQHRLIIDGGFTRLYCNWDTAGTGRYVKNAAAWSANFGRFGDEILSEEYKKERTKIQQQSTTN